MDTVQVTVIKPDLGADSNNDGVYDALDGIIEDRSDLPGLYVGMNDNFDEEDELEDFETAQASKKPCPAGQYAVAPTNDLEPIYVSLVPGGDSFYGECDLYLKGGRDHLRVYAIRGSCDAACPATGENVCWKLIDENYDLAANYLHSQGPIYGWALYVEGILPGEAQMFLEFWHNGHKLYEDQVNFTVVQIDADVDSDNTVTTQPYAPDESIEEDRIEERTGEPGRFVLVNDDDDDLDGILDYDDGYNANNDPIQGNYDEDDITYQDQMHKENDFVMLKVKIAPSTIDLDTDKAWVKVSYLDASPDPNVASQPTDPFEFPGRIRLWKRPGDEPRDGRPALLLYANQQSQGDWIAPGEYTDLRLLMPDYATLTHEMTLYIEGVEESRWFGGVKITFELDPDGEGPAPYVHMDTVQVTVATLNLSITGVTEAEEETRGGVITLNNDNDDFGQAGARNYEPDWQQNGPVVGENDLQQITLDTSLTSQTTVGQLRLEISAGTSGNNPDDTNVKVWTDQTKGTIVLDGANKAVDWTIAEFDALRPGAGQPVSFWVEGFRRSGDVKDVELKFSYRKNPAAQTPSLQDNVRYTVVQLMLDVDWDRALIDDNPIFSPGYDLAGINPLINHANPAQEMALIVAPLNGDIVTMVLLDLSPADTTAFRGYCMNQGSDSLPDFSFHASLDLTSTSVLDFQDDRATHPFHAKDYGGRTVVLAEIHRAGTPLTACELRVPLDTDRDLLPDFWETANADDTIRPGNPNVFRVDNPDTQALGAPDAVVAMPSAHYDYETQTHRAIDPPNLGAASGNGLLGDGLTAVEEYRGFFYGNDANGGHRHHRTSPHVKDLFVHSTVQEGGTDLGLGYLIDLRSGPNVEVHRINDDEWTGPGSRIINNNRDTTGMSLPAWQGPQRALHIYDGDAGDNLGISLPGSINTGMNGICQSAAVVGDFQEISVGHGEPNSVIVWPGPNGIIDPPFDNMDALDPGNNRIVDGGDGRLDTVKAGYIPLVDDRVRGQIRGPDGVLQQATVAAMNAADVLVGEIQEGPDSHLELATVAGVTGDDSLALVVIDAGLDGFLQTQASGDDVLDLIGQTISPGVNGLFDSAIDPMDEYRGSIQAGPDGILQSRPANENDVIVGTIEEGTDSNLQSRPYGDDYVTGYIDGGDLGGATGGKLNPLLNNGTAPIAGVGGIPANDDVFDWANDRITSGPDGVAHTIPLPWTDDVADPLIPDGHGLPYALCVDRNDHDGGPPEYGPPPASTDDLLLTTVPVPDDLAEEGPGIFNDSPNEHGPIIVDVAAHNDWFLGWNSVDDSTDPAPPHMWTLNAYPSALVVAALRSDDVDLRTSQPSRQNAIRESIAHEGGHGFHLDHYYIQPNTAASRPWNHLIVTADATYAPGSFGEPWSAVPPPAADVDVLCSNVGSPIPNTYHPVSIEQIRLHLKHP
jgi:hypothetical protein